MSPIMPIVRPQNIVLQPPPPGNRGNNAANHVPAQNHNQNSRNETQEDQ